MRAADTGPIDLQSRLLRAARPVLDALADDLRGSPFSVLLADRDARIVDRRLGVVALGRPLDAVLAAVGHQYLEEAVGTNALSTAFEDRAAVTVSGDEHFLESLKDFSCSGHPIIDPTTGRLEGVLDVTGLARDFTPLLVPLVARACLDIRSRFVGLGDSSAQRSFAAFEARAHRTRSALIVIGDDISMANAAGGAVLTPELQRELLHAASGAVPGAVIAVEHGFAGGPRMHFRCEVIVGGGGAVLCEAAEDPHDRKPVPRGRPPAPAAAIVPLVGPLLVWGESGTGKSTEASSAAGPAASRIDMRITEPELRQALVSRMSDPVVLDDLHLASRDALRLVAELLDGGTRPLVATAAQPSSDDPVLDAVLSRFAQRRGLEPLRARTADFAALAAGVLRREHPGAVLSPQALAVLESHPWRGNLHELRSVLRAASTGRQSAVIGVADLPEQYRVRVPTRHLSPLESAEHDTISRVLQTCHGNKAHAAKALGIGRSTLYRRMQALGIDR